jgi:hypothetical protein
VLDRSQGNKREACRILNISYHTLNSYLRFPIHDAAAEPPWEGDAEESGLKAESTV